LQTARKHGAGGQDRVFAKFHPGSRKCGGRWGVGCDGKVPVGDNIKFKSMRWAQELGPKARYKKGERPRMQKKK